MADNNIIKKITDQEMDRKDFLKYSGVALLGLAGLKTIVSLFTQIDDKPPVANTTDVKPHGFGGGKYGV